MKREVQLYISDTRVDLFKDETISITDSIQNISDISKVFTPFSKTFNLPASATNNKLFQHYYNFNIRDGFDARFQVSAKIEINFVPFRNGKIRLDGVSMKNNKPYSYKVVFFGEPSSLNDLFGEEDLSSLNPLSTYDIEYNLSDLLNAFKTGLQSTGVLATNDSNRNIVVPLITLKNYYTYDTTGTNRLDTGSFSDIENEVKPAIKLKRVIEAIQTQYNIAFNMVDEHTDEFVLTEDGSIALDESGNPIVQEGATTDIKTFFGSEMFDELYLWLHREKTPSSAEGTTPTQYGVDQTTRNIKYKLSTYTSLYPTCGSADVLSGDNLTVNEGESYTIRLRLAPSITTNTGEIIVRDITTNEILYYKENIAFNSSSTVTVNLTDLTSGTLSSRTYKPEIRINCQTGQTFASLNACGNVGMQIDKTVGGVTTNHYYGNASTIVLGFGVFIQDYLPKMKIIDFLAGLFKMFNLVAYTKVDSSTIYVETFDDYMTKGVVRDITEYIDISRSNINRPVPYSRINFKYSPPVTQTSLRFIDKFAQVFGDLKYQAPEKYDGQEFNQNLPFERSVLINLVTSSGAITNNILGWWVDADSKTALGKPFIFFNRLTDASSYPLFVSQTTYNAPSNVSVDENHTLNFNAEYDEFNRDINENSLFKRFYEQYIIQTFQENGRIIKLSAQLPISFMLNYELNDIMQINGEQYYINSINMNLATGKSELELIAKTATYTNSVLT